MITDKEKLNRIWGSLIGGAAGDALGYAVEFMSEPSIITMYGENGITKYELDRKTGKAIISDDTQMTIFTAAGILAGETYYQLKGLAGVPRDYINLAYRCWYQTQTNSKILGRSRLPRLWLNNIPELNYRRAPGNTCISAIASGQSGSVEKPINDSCGCGGVMRVAPLGLHIPITEAKGDLIREGAEIAALTHGHALGYLPAALITAILGRIVYFHQAEDTLENIVIAALDDVEGEFAHEQCWLYFRQIMERAVILSHNQGTDQDGIHMLGQGWKGHEALAIAVYCALRHTDDFSRCIIAAVNHGGDSDSTGAIAGNILGAWLGIEAIDMKWIEQLELWELLMDIGKDICYGVPNIDTCESKSFQDNKAWFDKYSFDWVEA